MMKMHVLNVRAKVAQQNTGLGVIDVEGGTIRDVLEYLKLSLIRNLKIWNLFVIYVINN